MPGKCKSSNCGKDVRARGYCSGCYTAKIRSGELKVIKPRRTDDLCAKCRAFPKTEWSAYCRSCANEYERSRREPRREEINSRQRELYQEDPERFKGYRLRKFGLTLDQFNTILESQDHSCAICGSAESLHVDHDHTCCPTKDGSCGSCIRGLLCANCNNGIGRFKDSPDLLIKASEYVKRGKKDR